MSNWYFQVRFSDRHDNLGDQFIFLMLVEACRKYGWVVGQGVRPTFARGVLSEGGRWKSRLVRSVAVLRGKRIVQVLTPGAVLWSSSAYINVHGHGLRGRLAAMLTGDTVSLGRSVIPGSDHSWCAGLKWIGVRDRASLAALQAAGFERATYFPDLSFLAPPQASGGERPRAGIGFSFRATIPELKGDVGYERLVTSAFSTIVTGLRERRDRLVGFHQVEEDRKFVDELSAAWDLETVDDILTLSSFHQFYQRTDVVVSNRLHCLLLAGLCGAIPVALTTSTHTKLVSLYETIGLVALFIDAERDDATARLDAILHEAAAWRETVNHTFAQQRRIALDALDRMFGRGALLDAV